MANTIIQVDLYDGSLPVLAMVEKTDPSQVAPNAAGYILTQSLSSIWDFTFVVSQACVGIYRVIILDGDGLAVALGYVDILSDSSSTYRVTGDYLSLAVMSRLQSTPQLTLTAINADATQTAARVNSATSAAKPTSPQIVAAIKADADLGMTGLVADAKRSRQFITNKRSRAVIGPRQHRYTVRNDADTADGFEVDFDPLTGNIN